MLSGDNSAAKHKRPPDKEALQAGTGLLWRACSLAEQESSPSQGARAHMLSPVRHACASQASTFLYVIVIN